MTSPNGSRDELRELLRRYNERPGERQAVVAEIEQRFLRPAAILVLDSSGFTRTVRRNGIVHFLALLERLERTVSPLIAASGGRILRTEADNIFAVFDAPERALAAARDIMRTVQTVNEALPEADELDVSIGIGNGPVLLVGDDDLYGDEMNLACKLGEDLARRGEVLVTAQAHAALRGGGPPLVPERFSISGVEIQAYRLVWEESRRPGGM